MEAKKQEPRFKNIIDKIILLGQGNYNSYLQLASKHDELDAICMLLNMLTENLKLRSLHSNFYKSEHLKPSVVCATLMLDLNFKISAISKRFETNFKNLGLDVGANLISKISLTDKGRVAKALRELMKNENESLELSIPFSVGYLLHIYNCQVDYYKKHAQFVINFVLLTVVNTHTVLHKRELTQNYYLNKKIQELYDFVNRTKDFKDLEIKKLSRQFGINTQTLKIEFKKRYHLSIYQYFMQKRMERCLLLMRTTPLNLKEISNLTGFNSYKSFHTNFIKFYGMSPTRYKKE